MTIIEESRRSGRTWRRALRVAAWTLASILAALVGPFGTFEAMNFEERLFYWSGLIGVSLLLALGIRKLTLSFLDDTLSSDLAGSVAIALTLGPAICVFNVTVLGHEALSLSKMLHHIVVVFTVSLILVLVRLYARLLVASEGRSPAAPVVVRSMRQVAVMPVETESPSDEAVHGLPAFLQHVEEEIGRNLRWITADDHYLWVHGDGGSARVLMRFRDALKELSHLPGLQVHRSHWVAIPAVVEVRPEGRRHVAILDCGTEVPVSRAYLPDLRAAGLMPDDAA